MPLRLRTYGESDNKNGPETLLTQRPALTNRERSFRYGYCDFARY